MGRKMHGSCIKTVDFTHGASKEEQSDTSARNLSRIIYFIRTILEESYATPRPQ